MRPNTLDDFWKKVRRKPGCWIWLAGKDADGYGMFWWKNRQTRAHRFVVKFILGRDVEGKEVCHTCDNPSCVRPDHLFVGTTKDNAQDREAKGRGIKGRKLTSEHVSNRVASRLKNGKRWTQEMKDRMSQLKRKKSNVLDEGGSSDLDAYLSEGSTAGLVRRDRLFEELG